MTSRNGAAASTVYEESVLRTLARRHQNEFLSGYKSAFEQNSLMDLERLRGVFCSGPQRPRPVGNRLNLNVGLYSELLRADPFHRGMLRLAKYLARFGLAIVLATNMTRVFLVNANLYGIDLRGIALRRPSCKQQISTGRTCEERVSTKRSCKVQPLIGQGFKKPALRSRILNLWS